MYKVYASGIGAMIAVMIMVNSLFAEQAGYLLSILVIQLVGIFVVSLVLVFRKEQSFIPAPFYLYFAGVVGIFLLFSNNYCFQMLGASSTLALGIMGQSVGSILTDSTGFLGMTRYPYNRKKFFALVVAFAGIAFLIEDWRLNVLIAVLAFFTGMLVLLSMILNTQLALRVGLFRGTRINFITGFLTTIVLIFLFQTSMSGAAETLSKVSPILIFGGGILGVLVIVSINIVFPKIPTLYSTLLINIGQMITGLIIDHLLFDIFSYRKLIGVLLVFLGVSINILIDKKDNSAEVVMAK